MTHILLTNDDGIEARGLRELLYCLRPLGTVSVVAPDHNWSAAGHTKTLHKPLRVSPHAFHCPPTGSEPDGSPLQIEAYTTTGTPSDCVSLAMLGILHTMPELVVSGINQGANLGHDLTYSGTVAAAVEAVIRNLPALSISLDSYGGGDFATAAQISAPIVDQVLKRGIPAGTFLNINIPDLPRDNIAGVAVTRLGRRVYRDHLLKRTDPRGRPYYWIGGQSPEGHQDEGTDIWALAHGYVSITPIQLDRTAFDLIPELQDWVFSLAWAPTGNA